MADPKILDAWDATSDAYAEWCCKYAQAASESKEERIKAIENLDALVKLFPEITPSLAFIYGSHLSDQIEAIIRTELRVPVPEGLADRLVHLSPDNPLEIQPDGAVLNTDRPRMKHNVLQLRNYYDSLKPAGIRGRPITIDLQLALRAYQMKLDGTHWAEILRELFPETGFDQYNAKGMNRFRARIGRLVERGQIEHDRIKRNHSS